MRHNNDNFKTYANASHFYKLKTIHFKFHNK
jgi:hypothetical protein